MDNFILKHTPVAAVGGVASQIFTKISDVIINDAQLDLIRNRFNVLLDNYNEALSFSINLSRNKENDDLRDEFLIGVFYCLEMYAMHPNPAKANSALKLLEATRSLSKDSARKSMIDESADIRILKDILSRPELGEDVDNLPELGAFASALYEAEDVFLRSKDEYSDERADNIDQINASDLKKGLVYFINDTVLSYVYVMGKLNPNAFAKLASQLNEIVKRSNSLVRRGSKDKEESIEMNGERKM